MRLRNDLGGYWCGLAACALTAALVIMPASGALAAPTGHAPWRLETARDSTTPGGQVMSLSCSAPNACTAVGASLSTTGLTVTLAERWNGKAWTLQHTPNPPADTVPVSSPELSGVSCPAADSCEAVGGYTVGVDGISLAEGWNGQTWTSQTVPVPRGSTSAILNKVSCASASFCEALGGYRNGIGNELGFAANWNGTAWHLQRVPSPPAATDVFITALSCVSASFCEAGGNSLGTGSFAERWDGTKWHLQTLPGSSGTASMSCASATFCESVAGTGGDLWDGMTWTAQTIPAPADSTFADYVSVSCATMASSCQAVGQYDSPGGDLSASATWSGATWTAQPASSPAGAQASSLTSVSCATATACEATGSSSGGAPEPVLAEAWNGATWQLQHAVAPAGAISNTFTSVSCASASFCEAVGSHSDRAKDATIALAEVWQGTGWKLQRAASPIQASDNVRMILNGVSCVSARFCEAVGFSSSASGGGAEMWDGAKWTLQQVPGGYLTAVSCISTRFCLATGGDGHLARWNGTSWSDKAGAPGFDFLRSVSCASPKSCEVIGFGPSGDQAEGWNGIKWSAQATPVPADGSSPGLSAVSCFAPKSCVTAGSYSGDSGATLTLAETWNGTRWKVQATPDRAKALGDSNSLSGVWCTSATFCAAVGQYSAAAATLTLAEVWNGKVWTLRSTANVPHAGENLFSAVSCVTGVCTAVGVTADLGQIQATLAESGN